LPQRQDDLSDSHVYEFDLQRGSGNAVQRMYMSFNFAVQKWRESSFFKPHRHGIQPTLGAWRVTRARQGLLLHE
jgi:hypothetical protein